jgi:hypothetical protein
MEPPYSLHSGFLFSDPLFDGLALPAEAGGDNTDSNSDDETARLSAPTATGWLARPEGMPWCCVLGRDG